MAGASPGAGGAGSLRTVLDPRIYRMSLLLPALALLVLAFSLTAQPGARQSSLAPGAFDGANVAGGMRALQTDFPHRAAGSPGDGRVAGVVQTSLGASQSGFSVSRDTYVGHTAHGERALVDVEATRPGISSGEGAIVVVAPRNAPGRAGASATAMLLELGRVLGGETLQRTVVLASVDGVQGARHLAQTLRGPVDAVIVLGDVAGTRAHAPVVIPWSAQERLAPTELRNTLAAAFTSETGARAGAPDLLSQLGHLAFPLTLSAQAPFADRGLAAVELSMSGERGPSAGEPVGGAGRLGAVGRAVVSTVTAFDGAGPVPAPSAYVIVAGQIVPTWAVALFVLALILPVALTTIDGLARARRRRYPLGHALQAVLAAASPFLAAGIVIVLGGVVGALPVSPDALAPGAVAPSGGAIAVMAVAVLAALGCAAAARPLWARLLRREDPAAATDAGSRDTRASGADRVWSGTAAATLLVMCVVAVALWIADPFAAALIVPALHLWLWALDCDLALPAPARAALLVLGAVPTAGLVLFYAHTLGFAPPGLAWEAVLLLSGHAISWVAAIEWSLALGCLLSAAGLVASRVRAAEPLAPAVTVRGPVGYAGPGSLGGTKSALRR